MKEDPRHIHISEYSYPLPDERIAKFPLPTRDQSKLLIYRRGEISEDVFTSLPEYLLQGSLMIFNNTKVIQARLHFRKETGALIEVFCLEPIQPNDYVLNFQQTAHAAWLCMIGNLKKWKDGQLKREMTVKGFPITLTATRGECKGTSHWVDFAWDNPEVTFADILEVFGELPIPPYLNRDTEESDKETYQTVYSKIKGSVAAPTAGLHFTPRVLDALQEKGQEEKEAEERRAREEQHQRLLDEQKQKFLDGERITGGMFLEITGRDGFDIHIRTKGTFNRHVRGIDRNGTVSFRKIKGCRTPDFTGCHKAAGDYLAFIATREGK